MLLTSAGSVRKQLAYKYVLYDGYIACDPWITPIDFGGIRPKVKVTVPLCPKIISNQ